MPLGHFRYRGHLQDTSPRVTTMHMDGVEATEELVTLCHIDADSYVLDGG